MKTWTLLVLLALWCFSQTSVLAQMPMSGQKQADILKLMSELPPDVMVKIQQLGKILQQDLKDGKLTQDQIQEELVSGNLEQKLRDLNPEAGPLLDDIAQAMKYHPDADNLPHILDGLTGPGK
jgi:uncharacterized protein YjaZ